MRVLVHAGICDNRMWDSFELPRAVRHELRGYGQTPAPPSGEFRHVPRGPDLTTRPSWRKGT
jgi:hypothetical protein